MKKTILTLISIVLTGVLSGQNPNFNFSESNFSNWNPTLGQRGNCCAVPFTSGNSHTVITTPGSDPVVGSALPRIPPGADKVVRLGSPAGGVLQSTNGSFPYGWRMYYDILVEASKPILFYQIAVVGDGTHACGELAHTLPLNSIFQSKITDPDGNLLSNDACSEYEIQSCSGGAMTMKSAWNTSVYFPWSSVGIDLSPYIGQKVRLEFTQYACYYWGFHGNSYTYIIPDLITERDTIYYCKGADSVEIEGLPRFNSYNWSNGKTTQNITVQNPSDGDIYTCTYGSFNGCSMTREYVLKENPLKASFVHASGSCNEVVFTNASTSPFAFTGFQWQFGDAKNSPDDTSVLENPAYVFSDTGLFDVRFIVTDQLGCSDTVVKEVQVQSGGNGDFLFSQACTGKPVLFTDISSGTITGHEWNFGDGTISTQKNPQHHYSQTGTYLVRLITENSAGCKDTVSKQVEVKESPTASFEVPDISCESELLVFTNTSTGAADLYWDFGDGSQSVAEGDSHTYTQAGNYTVTLVVTHSNGCTDTARKDIELYPKPVAAFTANPLETGIHSPVIFTNLSQGHTSQLWNFGDGNTSGKEHPTHLYWEGGEFEVLLTVSNEHLCTDTTTLVLTIFGDLSIPNVFTPNGDGLNDRFSIVTDIPFEQTEIVIFNRWGDEVFRSDDPTQGWDGTINGNEAPTGTYIYLITLKIVNREADIHRGVVTLLR